MKRPWPFALAVTALLLALGAPFLNLKLGTPDDRVLPPSADTREASDGSAPTSRRKRRSPCRSSPPESARPTTHATEIDDVRDRPVEGDGVARVDALTGSYIKRPARCSTPNLLSTRFAGETGTWLSVVPGGRTRSASKARSWCTTCATSTRRSR